MRYIGSFVAELEAIEGCYTELHIWIIIHLSKNISIHLIFIELNFKNQIHSFGPALILQKICIMHIMASCIFRPRSLKSSKAALIDDMLSLRILKKQIVCIKKNWRTIRKK